MFTNDSGVRLVCTIDWQARTTNAIQPTPLFPTTYPSEGQASEGQEVLALSSKVSIVFRRRRPRHAHSHEASSSQPGSTNLLVAFAGNVVRMSAQPTSSEKPVVVIPEGAAPTDLTMEDLIVGEGVEAVAGKIVDVHYVGVAWSTKAQFDASWDRGDEFQFALGAGQVIAGWDRGVQGMKVGGRRRLTIPSDLGYGARGAGGLIKGGETLVFVVDLLNVR